MEDIKNRQILLKVEEIIEFIKKDPTYQRLKVLERSMKENVLLIEKIEQVKRLQKEWVQKKAKKENALKIEEKLDLLEKQLRDDPIYQEYLYCQEEIEDTLENVKFLIEKFLSEKIEP